MARPTGQAAEVRHASTSSPARRWPPADSNAGGGVVGHARTPCGPHGEAEVHARRRSRWPRRPAPSRRDGAARRRPRRRRRARGRGASTSDVEAAGLADARRAGRPARCGASRRRLALAHRRPRWSSARLVGPGEPALGRDGVGSAHAVGGQPGVALEVDRAARSVSGPKMPSTRPASKPERAEAPLELGDVVAPEHRAAQVEQPVAQVGSPPRRVRSRSCWSQTPSARGPRAAWKRADRVVRWPAPKRPAASPAWTRRRRRSAAAGGRGRRHRGRRPGAAGRPRADGRRRASRPVVSSDGQRKSLSSWSSWPLPLAPTRRLAGCAVLEHDQGRDAHHVEASGDVGVVVDVELGDAAACRPAPRRSRRGSGRSSCRARTTRPRSRRRRARRPRRSLRRTWQSVRVVMPSAMAVSFSWSAGVVRGVTPAR